MPFGDMRLPLNDVHEVPQAAHPQLCCCKLSPPIKVYESPAIHRYLLSDSLIHEVRMRCTLSPERSMGLMRRPLPPGEGVITRE